jgi:hypothetical protein
MTTEVASLTYHTVVDLTLRALAALDPTLAPCTCDMLDMDGTILRLPCERHGAGSVAEHRRTYRAVLHLIAKLDKACPTNRVMARYRHHKGIMERLFSDAGTTAPAWFWLDWVEEWYGVEAFAAAETSRRCGDGSRTYPVWSNLDPPAVSDADAYHTDKLLTMKAELAIPEFGWMPDAI